MSQLGVGGLVDVNLRARLTQVPDNPSTRYAYIKGSIIEHAQSGFKRELDDSASCSCYCRNPRALLKRQLPVLVSKLIFKCKVVVNH